LALMIVGTPAILGMGAHSTDDLAVQAGQATPADQDTRDLQHYRAKIDKNKNAANALVMNGMVPPQKGGATTYTRIWGDVQPNGTITAPMPSPATMGGLPLDGGAATTYTYDPCRDANPAAAAIGLYTCPPATASTTTTTGTATTTAAGNAGGPTSSATTTAATIGLTAATTTTPATHP